MTTRIETTAENAPHGTSRTPVAASARGLVKTYGTGAAQVAALRGVDLDLPTGRMTAVMGPSGSGKSTLMHCLAGLDQPTEGTVTVAGRELSTLDDTALTRFRRDHVGFVFQAFNLLPTLTAGQNILLPLELAGRRVGPAERERYHQVVEVLGLADRVGHLPGELSGGQQQRVGIARALVGEPQVLVADEPTGQLDSETAATIMDLIADLVHGQGIAAVVATHDPVLIARADRVLELHDGRVVRPAA